MLNRNSYDQIYDEHAHIFSVTALQNILNQVGLEIFKVDNLNIHGGSNRIYVRHINLSNRKDWSVLKNIHSEMAFGLNNIDAYLDFAERVEKSKNDLKELLVRLKNEGNKIISYGATSKSTTVFNFCGIGPDIIDYITDTTLDKQGKFSPGMHIPVVAPLEGGISDAFLHKF